MTTASATLTPELRAMLRAAGCTDRQIDLWQGVEEDRPRHPTGATAARAVEALRLAGAPDSLARAYIAAGATPRRIVADLVMHLSGGKLPAQAATLLARRISSESRITPGSIWAEIRAAQAVATRNMHKPRHLQ